MTERKLVIFGTRNFAELAYFYFKNDSNYSVRAFAVDEEYMTDSTFEGLPVIASEQLLSEFPPSEYDVFVAIGYGQVNQQRASKLAELQTNGYNAASFVSSKASVAMDVVIEQNTMIMEYCMVHPRVVMGTSCILFPGSHIALKSHIGDHCWVVGATLGEAVHSGDRSFIGLRAIVAPGVTLGNGCIVGAGVVVTTDAPANTIIRPPKNDVRTVPERMRRTFGVNPPKA